MKTTISKNTLFEYLAGRANPLERQLAEDWIINNDNTELYYQWLLEFETKSPQLVPDQDTALKQLMQRLESEPVVPADVPALAEEMQPDLLFFWQNRQFWLIAASVALLVGCGWWFRDPIMYKSFRTGFGQTTDIYLEDGSKVALNANSTLKVPRFGFDDRARKVLLEGEAEFAVSHTVDSKRFIVKTSDAFQVEVLGTTFSVFARPRSTKVALTSGSVRIDYSQNNQKKEVMMEPGDLAFLDQAGAVLLEKKQDVKTFAPWKEQRYVFNATSVKEIAAMIEENFGRKVVMSDSNIAGRTITGNFKTKNAEELIRTVSEVLSIRVEQNGNNFLLMNN